MDACGYGDVLRAFFAKYNPIKLLDFAGFKVFDSATVDTNILLLAKSTNQNQTQAVAFKNDFAKTDNITDYVNKNTITNSFTNGDTWAILSLIEQSIKAKIERIGTPLKEWDINIYRGVLTGYNEAFIITGEQKEELIRQDPKSAEIIKPILRGKDIKEYSYEFADLWLIATHNGYTDNQSKIVQRIDINDYPAVKNHLDSHWEKIQKRYDQGDTSYNLRNCAYIEEFEKEKIVYSEIVRTPQFYLDTNKFYSEATGFLMTGDNLGYLCALLNSIPITFCFKTFYAGGGLGGTGIRYKKAFLENLPIPQIQEDIQFTELVNQIIEQKANNQDTTALEQQVDNLVYQLYELTDEEIAFIESKVS